MDANSFCVLDVETAGGSMPSFPVGFDLLLTGVRHGHTYTMYTAAPESMAHMVGVLARFLGPVVTFNGARFDLPLLDAWCQEVLAAPLPVLRHYDLAAEIERLAGHRISLENVSYFTFGEHKLTLGHHHHHGRIWNQEPWRMVDYNRRDLDLTHELFMRVLRQEPLFLGDKTVVLPLPD